MNKKNHRRKNTQKQTSLFKSILFSFFIKTLIVIALFLGSMIYIKSSNSNKIKFKNVVYKTTLSFAKIYNVYNKYLGDVIPFKNNTNKTVKVMEISNIEYSNIIKEKKGFLLSVNSNNIPAIKSGIVIEKKKSENYNTIIKIQDKDGINITYGCIGNLSVSLYDYVKKGDVIGNTTNNKLYLIFEKDGKYLSYEEFL